MNTGLSVVIATHDRPRILHRCLEHLAHQTVAHALEVIIVHDGENDRETRSMVRGSDSPFPAAHYESIPKSQQGTARNRGVACATAPLVLFINDDVFLEHRACEEHMACHERSAHGPSAVLGFTTWDPAVGITPVMRWLERSGWQFGYPAIRRFDHGVIPPALQHRFTYTCNISIPRSVAIAHPFREDVTLYGWEDIEWGIRLREAGVPLRYESGARALHHHHITMESSLRRMATLGEAAVLMERVHPGFDRVPRGWKRMFYELSGLLPTMAGRHRRAFLEGMRRRG